jgi:hypothetical protein
MIRFYENMNINNTQSMSPIYKYMPLTIEPTSYDHKSWIDNEINEMKTHNYFDQSIIYWYLDEISCVLIPRNKPWFMMAVPKIEEVWNIILNERIIGHEHRVPKPALSTQLKTVCIVRLDENGDTINGNYTKK